MVRGADRGRRALTGLFSGARCVIAGAALGYALAVVALHFLVGEVFGFQYVIVGAIVGAIGGKILPDAASETEKGIGGLLAVGLAALMVWTNLAIYR